MSCAQAQLQALSQDSERERIKTSRDRVSVRPLWFQIYFILGGICLICTGILTAYFSFVRVHVSQMKNAVA